MKIVISKWRHQFEWPVSSGVLLLIKGCFLLNRDNRRDFCSRVMFLHNGGACNHDLCMNGVLCMNAATNVNVLCITGVFAER